MEKKKKTKKTMVFLLLAFFKVTLSSSFVLVAGRKLLK